MLNARSWTRVDVPVVVHVGPLKTVEDPQLQFIYGEGQFVDKVLDVPVAGGRLQGFFSEDGVQQRFVEQITTSGYSTRGWRLPG